MSSAHLRTGNEGNRYHALIFTLKFYYHFLLKNLGIKRSQVAVPATRFCHVDATQLEDSHEFKLSAAQQLKATTGEKCFKLKLLEHPLKEVRRSTKI